MTVLYMIIAVCPNCQQSTRFVESFDEPVNLQQDVPLSKPYCPECGFHVTSHERGWDIHEEVEIERVLTTQEREQ